MTTEDALRDLIRATRNDPVASEALDRLADCHEEQFEWSNWRQLIAIERVAR